MLLLWRKVVDIVLEIFVSCCLLESKVLSLNQTIQKIALLAVLLVIIDIIPVGSITSLSRVDGELSLD